MEQITQTVVMQVSIMLTLIILGYILSKCRLITKSGASDMSDILLTVVTPCVLINAYQTDLDMTSLRRLGIAFLASIVIHVIMIGVSKLYFIPVKDKNTKKINMAGSMYSNCGFMAIPILGAALGQDGIFYGSAYLAVFNFFAWTHGLSMYSEGSESFSIKKLLFNPGVLGTAIAMILYFLQIRLPVMLGRVVEYVADLNTPLAMLLIGSFLARGKIVSVFKNLQIYAVSLLRLIIFPLIMIMIFKIIGADKTLAASVLISSACPAATLVALFAEKYGMNSAYASQISSATTLYSIVTIPIMVHLATLIL